MAADIRAVGPGKLSVLGEGISDIGTSLMNHYLGLQTLQEQNKLQLQQKLAEGIMANPMLATIALPMLKRLGISLPGMTDQPAGAQGPGLPPSTGDTSGDMTPTDQYAVMQGAGLLGKATTPESVPDLSTLISETGLPLFDPQALAPVSNQVMGQRINQAGPPSGQTPVPVPLAQQDGGLDWTQGPSSPDYTPDPSLSLRPPIQQLMAMRNETYQNKLNAVQDSAKAKLLAQTDPNIAALLGKAQSVTAENSAPGAAIKAGQVAGAQETSRINAQNSNAPKLANIFENEAYGRTSGTNQANFNQRGMVGAIQGAKSSAEFNAEYNVKFSPNNINRAVQLNKQIALSNQDVQAQLAANKMGGSAAIAGAAMGNLYNDLKGLSSNDVSILQSAHLQPGQVLPESLMNRLSPAAARLNQDRGYLISALRDLTGGVGSPWSQAAYREYIDDMVPNLDEPVDAQLAGYDKLRVFISMAPYVAAQTYKMDPSQGIPYMNQLMSIAAQTEQNGGKGFVDPTTGKTITLLGGPSGRK